MKLHRFLCTTAFATAMLYPAALRAQTTSGETSSDAGQTPPAQSPPTTTAEADPTANAASDSEIVVTGSRIARPNLDGSVPVTSISVAEITQTGDLSIGDTLNNLPQLRSTFNQANSTGSIGTSGLNLLDLRGLGTERTLTLVNGRRRVTATPGTFRVDTNTIPTELLERVDIVTGGNSAVYGSDAVSGVVNFVLKRDYEGLSVRAQGGISERGDRGSYQIGGVWGKNFLDDRANIAVSLEYAKSNTLLFNDRNEQTGAYTGVPGFFTVEPTLGEPPEGDGIPDTRFFGVNPGNKFGIISTGGTVITTCVAPTPTNQARIAANCTGELGITGGRLARNFVFLPDGTLVRDTPALDLRPVGGGIFGGLTASGVEGAMLLPGLDRFNANLLFSMEFSPGFKPFFEASYTKINANQTSTQPTFVNGSLAPTFFLDNPYLTPQARATIQTTLGTTSTTAPFTFFRFNNDIGTRAEDHKRETYSLVGGFRGTADWEGSWNYEVALNYGRTQTYYETGGNVLVANFNRAANAARDPATGQIVCRVNIDTNPNNNDPACRPINLFGEGAPRTTPDGLNYVLYKSSREQWAEMLNAVAFVSGDSTPLFELPGGPISFALGSEYRREDAYSDYDDPTQQGLTFLNAFATFDPPAIDVIESFGEIRIPLVKNVPFLQELTIEAAGRAAKYSYISDPVYAWNVGAIWSPISDLRLRGTYSRSVRAPNLSDVYATSTQTFANGLQDPCDSNFINREPNRVRNCAAAGIPTTVTLPDGSVRPYTNAPSSGISGLNQGNPNLAPEEGTSFTFGAAFQPRFLPGFSLTVDYYDITIKQVISGLSGQAIINRCYDDPVGIDNPFCKVVFRRTSADPIVNTTFAGQSGRRFDGFPDFNLLDRGATITPGFLNQPFNFAKFKSSGIDLNAVYSHDFGNDLKVNFNLIVAWLENREQYTFISDPNRATRLHGTLGAPEWEGAFSVNGKWGAFDFDYDLRYLGKQTIGAYETQFSHQGRPPTNADAFPIRFYDETFYHDVQLGISLDKKFRFYIGVDNVFDTLPPLGLTGTGDGSAIFPLQGRYFYSGARVTF